MSDLSSARANVNLGSLPEFGDPAALRGAAESLGRATTAVVTTSTTLGSTWHSLGGHFHSPATSELLAATRPGEADSRAVQDSGRAAAAALEAFATAIDALNRRKANVISSVDSLNGSLLCTDFQDSDPAQWRSLRPELAAQESSLNAEVAAIIAAWEAAQSACAAALGKTFTTVTPRPGAHQHPPLGRLASHPAPPPAPVEVVKPEPRKNRWGLPSLDSIKEGLGSVAHEVGEFGKGLYEGGKEIVVGVGDITGINGREAQAAVFSGMAQLGGAVYNSFAGTEEEKREARAMLMAVAKETIHLDQWRTNPAKALGLTVVDAAGLLFSGGGVTAGKAALKGASVARTVTTATKATRAVRAVDAASMATKAVAESKTATRVTAVASRVSGSRAAQGYQAVARTISESAPVRVVTHSAPVRAVASVNRSFNDAVEAATSSAVQKALGVAVPTAGAATGHKALWHGGTRAQHSVVTAAEAREAFAPAPRPTAQPRITPVDPARTRTASSAPVEPARSRVASAVPAEPTRPGTTAPQASRMGTEPVEAARKATTPAEPARRPAEAIETATGRATTAPETAPARTATAATVPDRAPAGKSAAASISLGDDARPGARGGRSDTSVPDADRPAPRPTGAPGTDGTKNPQTGSARTPAEPVGTTRMPTLAEPVEVPGRAGSAPDTAPARTAAAAAAVDDIPASRAAASPAGSAGEFHTNQSPGDAHGNASTDGPAASSESVLDPNGAATLPEDAPLRSDTDAMAGADHTSTRPEGPEALAGRGARAEVLPEHDHARLRQDAPDGDLSGEGGASEHEVTTDADTPRDIEEPGDRAAGVADHTDGSDGTGRPSVHHSVRTLSDEQILEVKAASVETPGGRAFHGGDPDLLAAASNLEPVEGVHTVDLHAQDGHAQVDGKQMTGADLAHVIADDPSYTQGTPVLLMAYDTGAGGTNSLAADVARQLDVTVTAPDKPAWSSLQGGKPWAASVDPVTGESTWPPDGSFHDFTPDGSQNVSALHTAELVDGDPKTTGHGIESSRGGTGSSDPTPADNQHHDGKSLIGDGGHRDSDHPEAIGRGAAAEDAIARGVPEPGPAPLPDGAPEAPAFQKRWTVGHPAIDNPHIRVPEGYEPITLPDPNPNHHTIESRQLPGGGIAQFEMDGNDNLVRARGQISNDDVAFSRSDELTNRLDRHDRDRYRRMPEMKLAGPQYEVGHGMSVQALGTSYDRILHDTYDLRTAFQGRFAHFEDALARLRTAATTRPDVDLPRWDNELRKLLNPKERSALNRLLRAETRINLTPQLRGVNYPDYYDKFESRVLTRMGGDAWRGFEVRVQPSARAGIPERYDVEWGAPGKKPREFTFENR